MRNNSNSSPSQISSSSGLINEHLFSSSVELMGGRSVSPVVGALDNLKIFRKRGRPRKLDGNTLVKAFQLPRNGIKRRVSNKAKVKEGGSMTEAEKVLESCLLMGLEPTMSKSEALVTVTNMISN